MRTFALGLAFLAVLAFSAPSVYAKKHDKGSQAAGKHGGKKGEKIKGKIATAPDASGTFTVNVKDKKSKDGAKHAGKKKDKAHKGKQGGAKNTTSIATNAKTKVKIDGQSATVAQLQKGMDVKVKMVSGVAKSIKAKSKHSGKHKGAGKKSKVRS